MIVLVEESGMSLNLVFTSYCGDFLDKQGGYIQGGGVLLSTLRNSKKKCWGFFLQKTYLKLLLFTFDHYINFLN